MAVTFSSAQFSQLQNAINLMVRGTATELPFDANVIDAVTLIANQVGFNPGALGSNGNPISNLGFKEAARNNPISTLLEFVAFVGHP